MYPFPPRHWIASSAIQVAFSADAGESFGDPSLLDAEAPLGRVDVVLDGEGGAVVSWLAGGKDRAAVRLQRISSTGVMGHLVTVAETSAARASGFPRLVRLEDRLFLIWVDIAEGQESRIRAREISLAELPPPIAS